MKFICHRKNELTVEVKLKKFGDTVDLFIADFLVGRFTHGKLQLFALSAEKLEKFAGIGVKTQPGRFPRGLLAYLEVSQL